MSAYEALIRAVPLARQSPMLSSLPRDRPWFRLIGFILLTVVFFFGAGIVFYILTQAIPAVAEQMRLTTALPDTPMRLLDESVYALATMPTFALMALAILAAASVAYRRRMTDFLWPGRAFSLRDLAIGFLAMGCVAVIMMPVYVWRGSDWAPPLLDPLYADWTRPVYVLASLIGLGGAAAAEEVVCRGVLLRLTTQLTRHPLLLCLINGLLFSALHLDPDPVGFVARAMSGALWTWAAIRLSGLEFAIGAHLANNLMITLFWQPLSAFEVGRDSEWIQLAPEVVTTVVMLIIIERLAAGPRDWRFAPSAPRRAA